ncbi:leucine-rich repeat domain-containing protein [Fulvivirga aurantia]|uniref:leucine-rich repeat domain-containing protein n=1 Tax=Fulvivirga aurantia TaxID=2529383 RepID=UPI0016262E3C|nr:leucine-rich repeat domain-containing protein [Fulvivirga aurantia]
MKTSISLALVVFLLFTAQHKAQSQDLQEGELESYHDDVRQMVSFFEYMLNTLGSKKTSARDKDVIITQSFEKIFRDPEVQVEDDLDENRDVITNKDVSAYLKDVDFFFKDVQFDFEIEEITHETNDDGNLFFKVSMIRNLKGLTVNNDSVNNTIPRFIEINYNPEKQDLQIASIYTNEFNEKKALKSWWTSISYEWRTIFKQKYDFTTDSLTLDQIKTITNTDTLDISDNKYVISIDALANLTDLKSLSLSNTSIKDVAPLRNLTDLEHLDLSRTDIEDISMIKYCRALKSIDLSHTQVRDIEVLSNMHRLENLNLSHTEVDDLTPISELKNLQRLKLRQTRVTALSSLNKLDQLQELNVSQTAIHKLEPLSGLNKLSIINLDSTNIIDLQPLGQLNNLEVVSINFTSVGSLEPLSAIKSLKSLYCDNTPLLLTKDISTFARNHPKVLIVYASEDTQSWWVSLSDSWRAIFQKQLNISNNPSKETLAKVTAIDSLDISHNSAINSLEPLKRLRDLRWLDARHTSINDITALKELNQITYLNISNTEVSELKALKNADNLQVIEADSTLIIDLTSLEYLKSLKTVYVDNTPVSGQDINLLIDKNPEVLVIFQTDRLIRWWLDLPKSWSDLLKEKSKEELVPTTEQLHQITQQEDFELTGTSINTLAPLSAFIRLKALSFNNTGISDLSPLAKHENLKTLVATNSPVSELSSLAHLKKLKMLSIANTPVEELDALENLTELREINCSGTQIKRLNELELLHGLEKLDCSNTRVKRLDPVQYLSLSELICYNTRISSGRVEDFKEENPSCSVTYY